MFWLSQAKFRPILYNNDFKNNIKTDSYKRPNLKQKIKIFSDSKSYILMVRSIEVASCIISHRLVSNVSGSYQTTWKKIVKNVIWSQYRNNWYMQCILFKSLSMFVKSVNNVAMSWMWRLCRENEMNRALGHLCAHIG